MSILKFLGFGKDQQSDHETSSQTETVRKIVKELDQMEPTKAKYVASFAYLLSRVAHADLDISDEETREMERIVMQQGGLEESQALIVVQMAKTQKTMFGGTENFLVTREFGEMATRQQKHALLKCLFGVAAADLSISTIEDNEISQIASELNLTTDEYTSVKTEFREYLAVLKKAE